MSAARTPGPWAIAEIVGGGLKLTDANGEFLSFISDSRYMDGRDDPICEANNAFIIEACNSHDANVARIEELEAALRDMLNNFAGDDNETPFIVVARAALAGKGQA